MSSSRSGSASAASQQLPATADPLVHDGAAAASSSQAFSDVETPAAQAVASESTHAAAVGISEPAVAEPMPQHVITFTEVVLGPEWAAANGRAGSAEGNMAAQQPDEVAQPRTTAIVGGTAAGELTGNTHYIVQQPDNTVDVAIHTERLAELKAAAAAQAAANPQTQEAAELAAQDRRQAIVLALQGSEHRNFMRRRAAWLWIMFLEVVFYIVLAVLCSATPRQFRTENGQSSWGSSELRRNWIRDFAFAYSNSEVECILDMVFTLFVALASFLGAFLFRRDLLGCALMGQFIIVVLGVASVLSPVIVLRLAVLVLGFQMRAGVLRWHPGPPPAPFFRQLGAQLRAAFGSLRMPPRSTLASCRQCCCPWRSRRADQTVQLAEQDVEAGRAGQAEQAGQGPSLNRTSVSLQLGDYIQPAAQARQLVWNRGAGLQRDSPILENATRARIYVDAQGRRSMRMSTLGSVSGTAQGDRNYS